jgi:hypothetical protein
MLGRERTKTRRTSENDAHLRVVEHLDVVLDVRVVVGFTRFAITEVMSNLEVARVLALLLERKVEKRLTDGKLTEDFLVLNAVSDDEEESDLLDGLAEVLDKLLLSAGLAELAHVDESEVDVFELLLGRGRALVDGNFGDGGGHVDCCVGVQKEKEKRREK